MFQRTAICGHDYSSESSKGRQRKFCSDCDPGYKAAPERRPCEWCGAMYWPRVGKSKPQRFCSRTCQNAAQQVPRERRHCAECGAEMNVRSTDARTKFCSRECSHSARRATDGCAVDGCDKPYRAKGLCASHYNALIPPDKRHKKYATPCHVCGKIVAKNKSGQQRKAVCSYACRRLVQTSVERGEHLALVLAQAVLEQADAERRRAARLPALAAPSCAIPERHPARLLAQKQSGRWWGQVVGVCCAWCGDWVLVVMSTGVPARSLPRHCSEACAKAHGKSKGRRRVRRTYVETTHWRKVAARDGLRCYICNRLTKPNDFKWVVGRDGRQAFKVGPRYPTVDHVEALAVGGEHSMSNARLACRDCNSYKGAAPIDVQLLLTA